MAIGKLFRIIQITDGDPLTVAPEPTDVAPVRLIDQAVPGDPRG